MKISIYAAALAAGFSLPALAQDEPSVERGARLAVTSGCHDCHTAGYNESGGVVDPAAALKGVPMGWRGPWGTTYASNLRLTVAARTEDEFLEYTRNFKALPPMPWYNVNAMNEVEVRSLYRYIASLGDPGDAMPGTVPPDQEPKTPYLLMAPVMPQQ
ncbi:MAG: cytochrome C [Cereibacter sphaeroides]|uniref:Cytochrome C n=1 Tax=Cereibacter sphaeroides TaxID=1063 RepID=A0A2W5SFH1_CERSP|nr:MAG: cytochrome C [Cereibacter sphaeroides]